MCWIDNHLGKSFLHLLDKILFQDIKKLLVSWMQAEISIRTDKKFLAKIDRDMLH